MGKEDWKREKVEIDGKNNQIWNWKNENLNATNKKEKEKRKKMKK